MGRTRPSYCRSGRRAGAFPAGHTARKRFFFSLPAGHLLAGREGLYLRELDGETFLLAADIGFWHDLVVREMPHTRFLIQAERSALEELVQSSVLPAFVSDLALREGAATEGRAIVPILDEGATARYYAVCLQENRKRMEGLF